jgi:hypothetical protein
MNNNKNKYKIGVLVGSLRRGSYSKALANTLFELAPENLELKHIEIGDLPYYNDDLDGDTAPQSWTRLRTEIIGCDGFIFVTPEYNRSIGGAEKRAGRRIAPVWTEQMGRQDGRHCLLHDRLARRTCSRSRTAPAYGMPEYPAAPAP